VDARTLKIISTVVEQYYQTQLEWVAQVGRVTKAVYTGSGYSAVQDPNDEELWLNANTQQWHRKGLELAKQYKNLMIDGNTLRVKVPVDVGGDPITKLVDVATFNHQDALQEWLKHAGFVEGDPTSILDEADKDQTWMR